MPSLQELKLIMDSVGPQAVGKNKLQVLATKSGSKEKKRKQNLTKNPKTP